MYTSRRADSSGFGPAGLTRCRAAGLKACLRAGLRASLRACVRARLAAGLAVLLAGGPLRAGEACRELQQQRDQLAREAMQAEIALLQTLRRRLCPELERQAADANALTPARPDAPLFHYGAWIACRRQAEWQLERSRPVLYRNRRGFTFYSLAGAGTARQADAVEAAIHERCSPAATGAGAPAAPAASP